MVRILAGMLVIVSLFVAVGGATAAVFSDTSSILGNTISTGQVDLDAHGEKSTSAATAKPIVASGLVPGGWTGWFRGVVYNHADSTNVRVYMYLDNVTGQCGKTNLEVTTGFAGTDAGERANIVYNSLVSGITGAGNRIELTGFSNFPAPNYLQANWSLVTQQRAQLDPGADNSYQNTTCNFDEVFVGETP